MFKLRPHHLLAGLDLSGVVLAVVILALTLSQPKLLAQQPECPPAEVLLHPTDPAYADAMELKHSLQGQGFEVHCIFPTKLGSIFQVREGGVLHSTSEGEASFRTNDGDIDVVFTPKPQTFADFKIKEHREGGGYLYTFTGTPRVLEATRFGSAYRIYFLKHDNQLLLSDEKLRHRLNLIK